MKASAIFSKMMGALQSGRRGHEGQSLSITHHPAAEARGELYEPGELADGFFVYGTLKQGHGNRHAIQPFVEQGAPLVRASTPGTIYDWGAFPAVTLETPAGHIRGEFVTVNDQQGALRRLDMLEGYKPGREQNLYNRSIVPVTLESGETKRAWIYHMPAEQASMRGPQIDCGEWTGRRYQV